MRPASGVRSSWLGGSRPYCRTYSLLFQSACRKDGSV